MAERIVPGVSYSETADALIGSPTPGAISIILVGTACKGPITPQYFDNGSLGKLIEMYGPADPYKYKVDPQGAEPAAELTLVRAAQQIYQGGPPPGGVWVKRIVSGAVTGAGNAMIVESFSTVVEAPISDVSTCSKNGFTLTTSGTGIITQTPVAGDILEIIDVDASDPDHVNVGKYVILSYNDGGAGSEIVTIDSSKHPQGFPEALTTELTNFKIDTPANDVNIRFTAKYPGMWYNNMKISVQNYIRADEVTSDSGMVLIKIRIPNLYTFFDSLIDSSKTTPKVSLKREFHKTLVFELGTPNGSNVPTAAEVVAVLTANIELNAIYDISLVPGSDNQDRVKDLAETDLYLSSDAGGTNWSSSDSAIVPSTVIGIELEEMLTKDGRLLVIAGADENMAGYNSVGIAHVKTASLQGQDAERVFITGTDNYTTLQNLINALNSNPYPIGEERVIAVTPGAKVGNDYYNYNYGVDYETALDTNTTVTLSGGYIAARVAGLIASNIPDDSPLWKTLGLSELEFDLPRYVQKIAIKQSILPLARAPNNQRVIKRAITTAGESSPFFQIMTRMVTDDIRYNMRLVAQGFIGKKNTSRIRNLLKNKLTNRVNSYVRREILLSSYTMDVSSERAQQIIGVVRITFKYQLVFYMEFLEFDLVLT